MDDRRVFAALLFREACSSHQFAVKKQVATCTNAESPLAKDGFGTMRHCIRGIGTPFTLAWFYMYNNTDSGH